MKLLGRKVISYIIDYGIVILLSQLYFFCANVFSLDAKTQSQAMIMLVCALVTVMFLTCYIPTQLNGQTIGQKITKLRVVNLNGEKRSYLQSFIRECLLKVTFGVVFIIFTFFYFIIYNLIIKHDINSELPHDTLLKTELISV